MISAICLFVDRIAIKVLLVLLVPLAPVGVSFAERVMPPRGFDWNR